METKKSKQQQCLDLIGEADKLYQLAGKAHSKSEAKRYKILADAKQEEANELSEELKEEEEDA